MGRLAFACLVAASLLAPEGALGDEPAWWAAAEPGLSLSGGEPLEAQLPGSEAGRPQASDPAPATAAASPAAAPELERSFPAAPEGDLPRYSDLPIRQARLADLPTRPGGSSDLPTYLPDTDGALEGVAAGSIAEPLSPEEQAELLRRRRGGNRCVRWAKQIVRLEDELERARAREDQLWEQATEIRLEEKETRFDAECLPPDQPSEVLEKLKVALLMAARLALLASGFGAF